MSLVPHTVASRPSVDFLNSLWTDHRGSGRLNDSLRDASWQRWFLGRWGFDLDSGSGAQGLDGAAGGREALRALLEAWADGHAAPRYAVAVLEAAVGEVRGRLSIEVAGAWPAVGFEPGRRDWAWVFAEVVRDAVGLIATGEARRLKVCGNPNCTWLFYDESRNVSRRWCDAATCGNLLKVRAHRARRAGVGS
jgi:predicted RNA-binding Zn ribbon-like protein